MTSDWIANGSVMPRARERIDHHGGHAEIGEGLRRHVEWLLLARHVVRPRKTIREIRLTRTA